MKSKTMVFILSVLLLSFSVVGFAINSVDKIEAYLANDMKFRVDNELWQPKDVDGSFLYPIIFNGRSYVPVRALLESKGVKVDFNNEERTIILDYPKNGWDVSKVQQADTDGIGGWDVSKLKRDDLNSVISMDVWQVIDEPDIRIIDYNSDKYLDMQGVSFVNESNFILSNDARLWIDGKAISINELASGLSKDIEIVEYRNGDSGNKILISDKTEILDLKKELSGISLQALSKITLEYNKKMGQVTGMNIETMATDSDLKTRSLDIYIPTEKSQRRSVSIIQRDRENN